MPQLAAHSTALVSGPPLAAATVAEALQRLIAQKPEQVALRTMGGIVSLTWKELGQRVRTLGAGLAALGLRRGDTLGLLLANTVECHLIDYAALSIGLVPFTIYNSSTAAQIEGQMRRADAEVVVTEAKFLEKARAVANLLDGQIRHIVVVNGDGDDDTLSLATVEANPAPDFDFDAAWRSIAPADLTTLIFTSGTTGVPKAAQYTHGGVMAGLRALDAGIHISRRAVVSFLPLAHAGGRVTTHYVALAYGSTITACPEMAEAVQHFADARPDTLLSVPRVFEKLQVAIEALIEAVRDEDTRARIKTTIEIGTALAKADDNALADSLTGAESAKLAVRHRAGLGELAPILAQLGLDHLTSVIVGGAPAAPELCQFFRAIGIPFIEAYGSSEASLCLFNRADTYKTGTVGSPLPGVEVRLAQDGELLIRSPFNFVGYRKQPEETAATLDADGWLHTGDIANIDESGYIKIVDRKKEIIINSAGKNLSPANIESAVRGESSLIDHVVAVGDKRKYITALITLDAAAVATFAKRVGSSTVSRAGLTRHPDVLAEIERAVTAGNACLSRVEQIKRYAVLDAVWTPDGDELTPTGKLKRTAIHAKYGVEIDRLYGD